MDASVLAACAIHTGFGLCRNRRLRAFRISSYGVRASSVQGGRPAVFLYPVGVVIGRIGYRRGAAAKAMLRGTWASVKSRMTEVDSLPSVARIRCVRGFQADRHVGGVTEREPAETAVQVFAPEFEALRASDQGRLEQAGFAPVQQRHVAGPVMSRCR